MMTIQIDPEVQSLLRPLSEAERALLEANIVAEGRVRDPLVVWDEWDILVDGHHRYAIATAHNLPFAVYRRSFADFDAVREWVSLNQAGRRNWTKDEREAWATARLRDGWGVKRVADALGVSDQTVLNDTAWPIWLLFLQRAGQAKDSPAGCPTGLYGGDLAFLRQHEHHRHDNWGRGGMVYWAEGDLKKLAHLRVGRLKICCIR